MNPNPPYDAEYLRYRAEEAFCGVLRDLEMRSGERVSGVSFVRADDGWVIKVLIQGARGAEAFLGPVVV